MYPGKGAIPGGAWETAATPPTLDYRGEDGGGLWEDEDGDTEGGGAEKVSGVTAEDSARQSARGLCFVAFIDVFLPLLERGNKQLVKSNKSILITRTDEEDTKTRGAHDSYQLSVGILCCSL